MCISGIRKNYLYWDYLNSPLRYPSPNLDHFVFADKFNGTQNSTNSHYSDLLDKQSSELMNISNDVKELFAVSRGSDNSAFFCRCEMIRKAILGKITRHIGRDKHEREGSEEWVILVDILMNDKRLCEYLNKTGLLLRRVGHINMIDLSSYFIIYISQLLLPDNNIAQLDWLEREFYGNDKNKMGAFIKVGGRSHSAGLVEFSGDCNNTPRSWLGREQLLIIWYN